MGNLDESLGICYSQCSFYAWLHGAARRARLRRLIRRKSPKMQSFGIKIERIDRDLLCIYETNAKWASVHICSK